MFAAISCSDSFALIRIAREFSPRIESWSGGQELVLDLSGLARLFGEPQAIAQEICRTAASGSVQVRVAIAATRAAARLLVRHGAVRNGSAVTVVATGGEADALVPASVDLLVSLHAGGVGGHPREMDPAEMVATLKRWGVRTLGAFAALPATDVAARLGQRGVRWQRVARGEDLEPLVPVVPEERFEQTLELEWPIEGLEPLSFVLGRLLDPLSVQLERRDRGAARIHLRLHLVTREEHARSLELPIPMREARTLRTLLLLDLESHPPGAAIDRVTVTIDPTPGRVVQFSLLTRPLPSPEQVSTLMARLHALMGESRCGSPALVDSWQPGAFEMTSFQPGDDGPVAADAREAEVRGAESWRGTDLWEDAASMVEASRPVMALRRFRHPVIARVRVEGGKPSRVTTDRAGLAGGRVESCAGPWRTAGGWWEKGGATCEVRGAECEQKGTDAEVRLPSIARSATEGGCGGAAVRGQGDVESLSRRSAGALDTRRKGGAGCDVRGAESEQKGTDAEVRLPSIARSTTEGGCGGAAVRGQGGVESLSRRSAGVLGTQREGGSEWGQRGAAAVLRSSGCGSVWQGANAVVRGFGQHGADSLSRRSAGALGARCGGGGDVRKGTDAEVRLPSIARSATEGGCEGSTYGEDGRGAQGRDEHARKDDRAETKRRATVSWDRDEWDVTLSDGATYRIFRERGPERWFVEGVVD